MLDINLASADAAEIVRRMASPGFEIEPARLGMILLGKVSQQRHDLVAMDEKAERVAGRVLADLLVSAVAENVFARLGQHRPRGVDQRRNGCVQIFFQQL